MKKTVLICISLFFVLLVIGHFVPNPALGGNIQQVGLTIGFFGVSVPVFTRLFIKAIRDYGRKTKSH